MGHQIFFGASPSSPMIRRFGMLSTPRRFLVGLRASGARGILLLQQSAPVSTCTVVTRRSKRSRRPRLQRWVQHAQARQNASSQVAVLESVVVAPLSQHSDSVPTEFPSEYAGRGPAAEVHMANSHEDPRQAGRSGREVGETSGARRPPRRSASRHTRRSNVELFRTPLLNLAAAAKIADSLQPTDSEAGRGIEQIRALLHTAQQQNSAVSQSHNRIHNSSVHANTHRSVHSPGISKFIGESKPETWLDDYRVAVQIGGGDDHVAMKHLPLMLDGSARAWLNQLAPSSIYSWADLARVFIKTFEGTCKRPAGLVELQHCVQKQNEPLRDFIQRWTTLYHTVENVTEHQAVCAFKAGVQYRDLYLKFGRTGDISMSKMMEIAARYANGEEVDRIRSGKHKTVGDGDGSNTWKQKQKVPSTPVQRMAVTNAKFKGKGKVQFTPKKKQFNNPILDQPCPVHTKMDEEGNPIYPKHSTRQFRLLIQGLGEGQPSEKVNEQDEEDK
ncbi:hypothetical protein ZWY2020_035317 [Hordeum vulgare]|nr:hypothetical protein ZWY2020_035317 [Hordeum vulgare]